MALQKTPQNPFPANVTPSSPPSAKSPVFKSGTSDKISPFWVGLGVSIAWVGVVLVIVAKAGPAHNFAGVALADWALGICAAVSPVAMVWMVTAYLQRASDIETIADPLRRQLTLITGESGAADARIRRFNQAIREQIELLRSAQTVNQDDLENLMDRVRQHRSELERFDSISTTQVKDIQDVIRRSMLQIEQMMDDKFTMLRVLDGKLQQNGDGVARQVESMRDQVARLLDDVESASGQMADAIARASTDGKKLADMSRLQEQSLTAASEAAADTLGGLSSKIDLSVARFLERASTAREEAERLASALDAQTRALDEFSNTLPTRVGEAESVLRGVADRLYASEKMASEQAVHLSEKLSQQVDGLQSFMDRFTVRLTDIDGGLDRRRADLHDLAERIGSTTTGFVASWEQSLADLHDRTGNSLLRFTVVNDETRRNAESVSAHLAETTSRYEDVVTRMRALSADSGSHMEEMTSEIAKQLGQFESLSKASNLAGEEVQARANTAMQNLQHVLERVLTAREATQAVGETLVKDIYAAVDQNEKMIARLNETAQLGARTINAATETMSRQQTEVAGKARASEEMLVESMHKLQTHAEGASKALREQSGNLMGLLAETQSQLAATDHKLQSFASQAVVPVQKAVQQIDSSAEQGLKSLSVYGEGLSHQVARLQEFHTRIGGMSEEMGKTTSDSAAAFEDLNSRFATARLVQEESVRQTLAQFAEMAERMQREVASLDGQAARSVEQLQASALKIGEQAYQMLQNAQNSGAQMKDVTAALQNEAAKIQSLLQKQTEEVGNDLAAAEQKFTSLGEVIRDRADAAYALLDHVASHYDDVTKTTFTDAEHRFTAMGEVIRDRAESAVIALDRATGHYTGISQTTAEASAQAQARLEALQIAMERQSDSIDAGAIKIEGHATEIAATTGRAVQNMSLLNDKLAVTHEAAVNQAQQTLNKIDECTTTFERKTVEMASAAENAAGAVIKASAEFGEQTSKVIDGGQQLDGMLRQLTSASSAIADQAAQIRIGMEQQNNRLLSQLADSVAQMDVTGGKLQQLVSVATQGADQASIRFADMTATASQRINVTAQDLNNVAERTETTLAALGANITQQAASLSVVGEQMSEQQRLMAAANESQRAQMLELFDKLGASHAQASEVAERSITYLTDSLKDIHRQMGLIGDHSQEAVGNVKMASMNFADQAGLLLQNAQAAEQQARTVLSVTAALQEQARHLRETLQSESERAGESLGFLLSRLTQGGAEVRELGVDTGAVLSGLQRALGEQTNELSTSMQQITERQRNLMSTLDAQRETINSLLNRLTLAQDETAATSERTALRLSDGAQQIIRHVETLDARAQSA
ncbi:MAG: hypothetical protein P4M15_12230, partial [Alphaproteobacteria bacterium]|nr:hypothetical protein [Alphaproteobacteria bacterium]